MSDSLKQNLDIPSIGIFKHLDLQQDILRLREENTRLKNELEAQNRDLKELKKYREDYYRIVRGNETNSWWQ